MTEKCNICGFEKFGPGPGGRMARNGAPPLCMKCRSLERHRSIRALMERLGGPFLTSRRYLQFSHDMSLDPSMFDTYERSIYGGDNSLDLQAIAKPDCGYDFISANHVIEFIPDDRRAFDELVRILSHSGVLQICFATPFSREKSLHYDEPEGPQGNLHRYGRDVVDYFTAGRHHVYSVAASLPDPVTGSAEPIHFFCRERFSWRYIVRVLGESVLETHGEQ